MPTGRMMGGPIQYHSFGNFISSGVVPHPSGAAARDAAGMQKGTDTYAATVPSGSFVLNRAASQMFGHKYLSGGGVAAMLTPGEIVLSPQQVAKHGLANVTRDNQLGRMVQRRQIGGPVYANSGVDTRDVLDRMGYANFGTLTQREGGGYAIRDNIQFQQGNKGYLQGIVPENRARGPHILQMGQSSVGGIDGTPSTIRELQRQSGAILGRKMDGASQLWALVSDRFGISKTHRGDQVDYRRRGGRVGEGKITGDSYQAMFDVVNGIVTATTIPSDIISEHARNFQISPQSQAIIDAGIPHKNDQELSRRAIGVMYPFHEWRVQDRHVFADRSIGSASPEK